MTDDIVFSTLPDRRTPLFIERRHGSIPLHEYVESTRQELALKLTEHGALLFRGFCVDDPAQFSAFVTATGLEPMQYEYGSTPRTKVTEGIYTSTEYPASREILLHNENAYYSTWPLNVAFCCTLPAQEGGGETPIADMRNVSRDIGPELMERFETQKVQYLRHFHQGFDLSWQDVFKTSDPDEVARQCESNGIEFQWLGQDRKLLRTVHTCQGVAYHHKTGERLFFNQAHLFHSTSMGRAAHEAMLDAFGADKLPRHSRFGDGTEIPEPQIQAIRDAFHANQIVFPWCKGDVMWIDNMQVAHGRKPFKGPRQVLATLLAPSRRL